ncbi:MAG TPA: 4-hydroxy-tetrahydrodipicolinate reductase [Dehalococcoidales bacterium]|nr:4-hydroxy-tetrahydrodipicolinate reductase [Dehalococcoidales bacterium]
MEPIKVVVHGAAGRVGQEVVKAVCQDPETRLVGAVELKAPSDKLILPDGSGAIPYLADLEEVLEACLPDVVVDFTIAKASIPAVRACAAHGVNMVIGTTGFTPADLKEMESLAATRKIGIVVAPNFALGAVLMMHLARIAGRFMDHAEIIELHHDRKLDAPSGTSLTTARDMAGARGKPFLPPAAKGADSASRGESTEGINIHSVRLPGLMAHQEVIFGAPGQTLSIRHDTINRECYMPGVMLAVKEVVKRKEFIYGLDKLLGL